MAARVLENKNLKHFAKLLSVETSNVVIIDTNKKEFALGKKVHYLLYIVQGSVVLYRAYTTESKTP